MKTSWILMVMALAGCLQEAAPSVPADPSVLMDADRAFAAAVAQDGVEA